MPVRAQQGDALEPIREMVMYARYREAIEASQSYLAREDLSAAERNAGLEILATVHLAMRDTAAADEVLERLYRRDPGHRLTDADASPPVIAAFGRASEAAHEALPITLAHEAPGTLVRRRSPAISVQLGAGGDAVHELFLAYRVAGESRYARTVMNVDASVASARIPLTSDSEDAYLIEYYVEATAPSGAVLTRIGAAAEPLTFEVPAQVTAARRVAVIPTDDGPRPDEVDEGGGVLTKWWFWTIVTVAVAGGVTGAVVGTRDDGLSSGSLETIRLP